LNDIAEKLAVTSPVAAIVELDEETGEKQTYRK
jgi:hypothetical protein